MQCDDQAHLINILMGTHLPGIATKIFTDGRIDPSDLFLDRVSSNSGWPQTRPDTEDDLELPIILCLSLQCWDYRCVPPT